MNKRRESFLEFLENLIGENMLEPIYQRMAYVGAVFVLIKIVAALITFATDIDFPVDVLGPFSWQLFIAILLIVSHSRHNVANLDHKFSPVHNWLSLAVELLAIIASLFCVGLLVVWYEDAFPFTFFSLSVMLFMNIVRRVLTDSLDPSLQILRFVSACWFLLVWAWIYLVGNETNWQIVSFSWALLVTYLIFVFRRRPFVDGD